MDNPLRYIDPKGNEVYVLNEEDRALVLSWINSRSAVQFAFNGNRLVATKEVLGYGHSQYYSDMLINAVENKDNFVYIKIADEFPLGSNTFIKVDDKGGAATVVNEKYPNFYDVYVSNREWHFPYAPFIYDDQSLKVMHELVGHVVTSILRLPSVEHFAIIEENKVRYECGELFRFLTIDKK